VNKGGTTRRWRVQGKACAEFKVGTAKKGRGSHRAGTFGPGVLSGLDKRVRRVWGYQNGKSPDGRAEIREGYELEFLQNDKKPKKAVKENPKSGNGETEKKVNPRIRWTWQKGW